MKPVPGSDARPVSAIMKHHANPPSWSGKEAGGETGRGASPFRRSVAKQNLTLSMLVALSLAITAALHVSPLKPNVTVFSHIHNLLTLDTYGDSWEPMHEALRHRRQHPGRPLYQAVFFENKIKFQYPPSSLLIVEAVWALPGIDEGETWILDAISLLAIAMLVAVVLRIDATAMRARWPVGEGEPRSISWGRWVVITLGVLTFYPLTRGFALGQIQTWLTLGAAFVTLCWIKSRFKTAGLVLGLMCAIKPHYGMLLAWGALRRQGGMVAAGFITAVSIAAISVARFGVASHLDYLRVLSFLARHGEAFHPNQSINGLMNRLLGLGSNLEWTPHAFPGFHWAVYLTTLLSTLLLVGGALFYGTRHKHADATLRLMLMLLTVTIASPIAWEHHYAVLLPIFVATLPHLLRGNRGARIATPLLILAYLLANMHLSTTHLLHAHWLNPLQSYLLLGGLLTLMSLYWLSWQQTRSLRDGC